MRQIVSPLSGLISPLGQLRSSTSLSAYAVNNFDPSLVFDFKNNYYRTGGADSTLSSSVTHTRASSATMTNSSGTLVTVGNNVPRTDHHSYNGSAWVNEGVLHESEARTNTATNSNLFSSNHYTKNNISVTASSVTSPDGSNNGWKITPTGTNPYIRRGGSISGNFTHSLYVKKDTADYVVLGHGAGTKGLLINFSFASGTVVDTHAYGSSTTYISNTVENVDNGWYRISVTGNTGANNNLVIFPWDSATAPTNLDSSSNASSSTVYIYGAQTEVASTPSSYIPTSGSTVTRAAETLTVPAANLPWPTPVEVTGTELVTNGTFDTDVSGWTPTGTGSLAWVSGELQLTSAAGYDQARQAMSGFTVGKTYRVTVSIGASSSNTYVQIVGVAAGSFLGSSARDVTFVFVASATTQTIALINTGAEAVLYDNISVKEINPLSVSIQIDGKMTYADDNDNNTTLPWRWRLDSSNLIYNTISTAGTRTGQPRFIQQQATSGYDAVFGANNVYSPDVNVPFNFAGRYGSTFINGAHEGTLLTANTTPTILPDLSSTNLELGYIFMGTIGKFRVWSDDLTDSGIAGASS